MSLSSSDSDLDSVNDVALLGLVAESSGLVGSGRSVQLHHGGQLSVLPGPHSEDEVHDFSLLLSPELLNVSVATRSRRCFTCSRGLCDFI